MSSLAQFDPNGKNQHEGGAKLDGGKIRPELIFRGFAHALEAVAEVATYGANKYCEDGWEKVPDGEKRYLNALYRHLLGTHQGEVCDPESELPHLAHAAWNALAVLELALRAEKQA